MARKSPGSWLAARCPLRCTHNNAINLYKHVGCRDHLIIIIIIIIRIIIIIIRFIISIIISNIMSDIIITITISITIIIVIVVIGMMVSMFVFRIARVPFAKRVWPLIHLLALNDVADAATVATVTDESPRVATSMIHRPWPHY